MSKHLRANLWLLAFTLVICSVLYPAVLLGIGQVFFPHQAEGSLIRDKNGKVIGSELIAQPFTSPEYFQPRPSAASYNAAASGASNWAASNYQLRERVARALGPIVTYKSGPQKGQPVGPDVQRWFQSKPDLVARWAKAHASVAQGWVKADKLNTAYVAAWQANHPDEVAQWVKDNPDTSDPKPEDLAVPFFESFSRTYPGTFPDTVEQKNAEGKTEKIITPVKEGTAIQGYFFDLWRQEHPQAELEDVPADLVMASGSGLDPHITLENARFQLDGVAAAWAEKTKQDPARVRRAIGELLQEKAKAPLGGLVGKPLINVLEVNRALRGLMEQLAAGSGGNGGSA